jgi:hypothetical protein
VSPNRIFHVVETLASASLVAQNGLSIMDTSLIRLDHVDEKVTHGEGHGAPIAHMLDRGRLRS